MPKKTVKKQPRPLGMDYLSGLRAAREAVRPYAEGEILLENGHYTAKDILAEIDSLVDAFCAPQGIAPAPGATRCKHCGHDPDAPFTASVCVDQPGNPVSALCTLTHCQHMALPPSLQQAEQTRDTALAALATVRAWLRGWPTTTCRSETGVEVPIVLMNPDSIEATLRVLDAVLAHMPSV